MLLDDGQIDPAKIAGLVAFIQLHGLPAGAITLWNGTAANVPAGWFLCDGLNGTPDLTDKFIVGAGDGVSTTYAPGDIGGTVSHGHTNTLDSAGAHDHDITVDLHVLTENEMPSHLHLNGVVDKNDSLFNHGSVTASPSKANSIDGNSSNGVVEGNTTSTGGIPATITLLPRKL